MRLQGKTYAWANADEYDRGWLGSKEGWDNWPYGGQKILVQNQPNSREFRPTRGLTEFRSTRGLTEKWRLLSRSLHCRRRRLRVAYDLPGKNIDCVWKCLGNLCER